MAFIGIEINSEIGRMFRNIKVPGKKVSENEYHITILCFDDEWPVKEVAKAMEAAYDVIQKFDPFYVKVDRISCFPKREDNPVPIIGKVQSDELEKLNSALKKAFDKKGIDFKKNFKDYKPHITLAWAEDEIKDMKIEPKVEFFVHEITLWGGDKGDDRLFVKFPFKGSEKKASAYLNNHINAIHKLASRKPNDIF